MPLSSPETSDDENFNDIFAPIGQEDSYDQEAHAALHPQKDIIPIYDVNWSIPCHFIWIGIKDMTYYNKGCTSMTM